MSSSYRLGLTTPVFFLYHILFWGQLDMVVWKKKNRTRISCTQVCRSCCKQVRWQQSTMTLVLVSCETQMVRFYNASWDEGRFIMLEMAKREKGWTNEVKKRERRIWWLDGWRRKWIWILRERKRESAAIILTEKVN